MYVTLVETTRGNLVETVHHGVVAVVDAAGRLLYRAGDPTLVSYWRSAAKPVQALALVTTGAAERFAVSDAELALACASHNGESEHTVRVEAFLARLGLQVSDLRCGAHTPYDRRSAQALLRSGKTPTALHCNCSGKHAGMLAVAKHLGVPTAGYVEPDHPVQQAVLNHVSAITALPRSKIGLGVDGCGVPTFALPLRSMALAFARLAGPQGLSDPLLQAAAEQVLRAMVVHPYLIAGREQLCTALLVRGAGRWFAKNGAQGVYCLGLPPETVATLPGLNQRARGGVGIAIKVLDGQAVPRDQVAVEVLRQLGALTEMDLEALSPWHRPPVTNLAGQTVGETRPAFHLESA